MECLICYKVYFNRPAKSSSAELDNFDTSLTISKLFDISPSSWLTEIDTFGPSSLSICPGCTEKLGHVHRMLQELDQLQSSLRGIKVEVFTDLIKSQETSQKNGYELEERSKIVKEISFRAKQNVDQSYSIISDTTVTRSQPDGIQMLAAKSSENIKTTINIKDGDDINRPNPAPPSSTLKNRQIIIEPPALPIQYPFPDENNAKDQDTNCKLRNRRPRKKLTPAKLKEKLKLDHSEIENPGLILVAAEPESNDNNTDIQTGLDDDINSIDDNDEDLKLPNPDPEPTLKTGTNTYSKLIRRKTTKKLTQAIPKGKPKLDNYVKKRRNFDTGVIKHCNICNITFERRKRYLAHFRKVHTGERPFQCDKCPKNYFSEDHLTAHLKIHGTGTSGKKRGSHCTICSKFYRTRKQLEHHMNSVHLQVKLWSCDSCPQSFGIKKSLEEHVVTQHVGQKFYCLNADCDKTFNSTSGLSYHVKSIHERAFKFTCQVENCGKSFVKKSFLKTHNERAHLKVKKFICDQCPDKKFYKKGELNLHYFANHAEESEKPHKCKYCSKAFASMTRLRNHLKLHTGVREQICHICGADYAIKSSLDSHIAHQHSDLAKNLTVNTTKRSRKFSRRNSVPIILNTPVKEPNVVEKQSHLSSKTSDPDSISPIR